MKTLHNKLIKTTLLVSGIILLNACGGGGSDKSSTTVPETNTTLIKHNGFDYGVVTSPHTSKQWLDRNLGAAQVCESSSDDACYGDYYQWGRGFDGHQDSTSATTDTQSTDLNAMGTQFIILKNVSGLNSDWAKKVDAKGSKRLEHWSKIDGSFVCPVGFRVPTIKELTAELLDTGSANIKNRDDAFSSFLALPSAGNRRHSDGLMNGKGELGVVWTGSVEKFKSSNIFFGKDKVESRSSGRAAGFSVRCIRD